MNELKKIEQKGIEAVRKLRRQKLRSGQPFMINSKDLKSDQCYLEYPDGSIKLAELSPSLRDFVIIRDLDFIEVRMLREKYRFL